MKELNCHRNGVCSTSSGNPSFSRALHTFYCDSPGCPFFETSAKTRINVDEVFTELVRIVKISKKRDGTGQEEVLFHRFLVGWPLILCFPTAAKRKVWLLHFAVIIIMECKQSSARAPRILDGSNCCGDRVIFVHHGE